MTQKTNLTDQLLMFEKRQHHHNRLLLVDGHNLLFQMFFGFPTKIKNKQGKVISGTLGFVSTLIKIIKNLDITHCIVIFDKEQELNNKTLNPDYKANRPDWSEVKEEDNPFTQIEDIIIALNHLQIQHTFSDFGFEADDYINTYAKENKDFFEQTFILSKDTDFYQIVSNSTFIVNYSGKNTKILSESDIFEKLGVYPKHYAFFKALTGDTADNIKGVEGIGKITAKKIISQYPNIEQLYQNLNSLPKSLYTKLENQKQSLELNQEIISFEIPEKIETLKKDFLKLNFDSNSNGYQVLKNLNIV